MRPRKLPADTLGRLLRCQRWGVCDAGTADMCEGESKTVQRFQRVAAPRAKTPPRQRGQPVEGEGVPVEEAPATLRPPQVAWVPTAWALGRGGLLWGDVGPRTQDTAAPRIAPVVARPQQLPRCLTDGWQAYTAAGLQVVGVVSRPRRRGHVGRKPKPRRVAPKTLFDAPVGKVRHTTGHVGEVSRRGVSGGPRRFGKPWRLRQRGATIQTACMERWYGT
jgi:hypothetical protein